MRRPKLNVLDENGEVIGQEERGVIHRDGLLHGEVHVWFFTPQAKLIFQHRPKDAETYPDLLDATVGGHIEIGETPIGAALKETREETGVDANAESLEYITAMRTRSEDSSTGRINNVIRSIYLYRYGGSVDQLQIEESHGAGFEPWDIESLVAMSDENRKHFISSVIDTEVPLIAEYVQRSRA